MSYTLRFSKTTLKDIAKHRKSGDKAAIKKLETLLQELEDHPITGSGQPELMKHDLAGFYSRRINKKHRLIYSIEEQIVTVHSVSAWSHYGEK